MKYIVLSFDDSMLDFKNVALPLLNNYGFKCSINTITGFVDKTIKQETKYLSIEDIVELDKNGFEIAAHSNSHIKPITIEDLEICTNKIRKWIGNKPLGVIAPFSKAPSKETAEHIKNHYLYFADYYSKRCETSFSYKVLRLFNHFFHSKKRDLLVSNAMYYYSILDVKKGMTFKRLPANRNNIPSIIIRSIKLMKNQCCLSICFHSIVHNLSEKVEFPFGAWTVSEFERLLKFLKSNKGIKVLTQKEMFDVEQN